MNASAAAADCVVEGGDDDAIYGPPHAPPHHVSFYFFTIREDINSVLMTVMQGLLDKYGIDPAKIGRLEVGAWQAGMYFSPREERDERVKKPLTSSSFLAFAQRRTPGWWPPATRSKGEIMPRN